MRDLHNRITRKYLRRYFKIYLKLKCPKTSETVLYFAYKSNSNDASILQSTAWLKARDAFIIVLRLGHYSDSISVVEAC